MVLALLISIPSFAGESGYPETMDDDERLVRSAGSPKWLAAVGRSVSKTSKNKQEQCSWSIVADEPHKDGIIVIGAGHCVDHWYQSNGEYEIGKNKITFTTNSGVKLERSIIHILKAEMNPGDYVIAKLNAPISRHDIKPLLNGPYAFSDLLDEELWCESGCPFEPFGSMAGYSADITLGQKGKVLTYDPNCKLNGGASGRKKGYCYSYEGASGGAVTVTLYLTEEMREYMDNYVNGYLQSGEHTFWVGSILGGQGGDDHNKTMFTPATHYTQILDPILAAH